MLLINKKPFILNEDERFTFRGTTSFRQP